LQSPRHWDPDTTMDIETCIGRRAGLSSLKTNNVVEHIWSSKPGCPKYIILHFINPHLVAWKAAQGEQWPPSGSNLAINLETMLAKWAAARASPAAPTEAEIVSLRNSPTWRLWCFMGPLCPEEQRMDYFALKAVGFKGPGRAEMKSACTPLPDLVFSFAADKIHTASPACRIAEELSRSAEPTELAQATKVAKAGVDALNESVALKAAGLDLMGLQFQWQHTPEGATRDALWARIVAHSVTNPVPPAEPAVDLTSENDE
jgi:hypothetical protein